MTNSQGLYFHLLQVNVRVVPAAAKARLGYGCAINKSEGADMMRRPRELEDALRIIPDTYGVFSYLGLFARDVKNRLCACWPN